MQQIHSFNSQEVAKILGVNVSTVKRWTDEEKLGCIKTSGGHRKFLPEHLTNFLEDNKKFASKAVFFDANSKQDFENLLHVFNENYVYLADYIFSAVKTGDTVTVQKILNSLFLSQVSLHEIYDNLLTPLLHRVGYEWLQGQITITQEHLYTQLIKDAIIRLQGIIKLPDKIPGRNALLVNVSEEMHDIALKMVHHLLELKGYTVYFSGQMTPSIDIQLMMQKYPVREIFISTTYIEEDQVKIDDLNRLLKFFDDNGYFTFIGGRGVSSLDAKNYKNVRILNKMADLADI
jgi:excisionase family DNA binding protein